MRLLNITNRYYIVISLALMLVGNSFLAYWMLDLYDKEVNKNLLKEKNLIDEQLYKQPKLQNIPFTIGDNITIRPIDKFKTFIVHTNDTVLYDLKEKKSSRYRVLTYEQQIDSGGYRISIRKKLAESRDIFWRIFKTIGIIGLDVVASFYLLSWWISKSIWFPFYRALSTLKNFDLRKKGTVSFQPSNVDEFNMLNKELKKLMEKVWSDYSNLKEFTENMSHETQTPLAIIHSKLDLLLQSDLTQHQQEEIILTLDAVNRLSKMNKALILLAKIDNSQFEEEQFNIGKIINKHLAAFDPFIKAKELDLVLNVENDIFVEMNPHLADMLLSNLISNAIRYNEEKGVLRISFINNKLMVENSGKALDVPEDQIFERFSVRYKSNSVGLGLAIVRRICDASRAKVSYSFQNNLHAFTVEFNPKKVHHEEPIIS